MKKTISLILVLIIVFTSSLALAEAGDDALDVIADSVILRPLGIVALLSGSVLYVISLPIATITDSTDRTYEKLIKDPYDYTFVRPVGEIGTGMSY